MRPFFSVYLGDKGFSVCFREAGKPVRRLSPGKSFVSGPDVIVPETEAQGYVMRQGYGVPGGSERPVSLVRAWTTSLLSGLAPDNFF